MALNQSDIDRLRTATVGKMRNFVDGDWCHSSGGGEIEVFSPVNGQQIGTIIDSSEADVRTAIAARANQTGIRGALSGQLRESARRRTVRR